jgi:6-phospho-beta-glucosidase
VRALSSHPWLTEIRVAEALYDEMAAAHKEHLPERLLR